jgi:putative tricarboxylic transport membrane protein
LTQRLVRSLIAFGAGFLIGCADVRPQEGTECLVPANPGGGWDLTCRSFSRVLSDVVEDAAAMRVTNLPGAGGGIAFAHVVARRTHDSSVIVAASPATTLRLAQRQFGEFTEKDVRWLAAIGADYGVIVVRADAPWPDLSSLMDEWQGRPESIVVSGGSAVGGQDHMKVLLLARAVGMDLRRIRYVPFDGGGEAMTALLGGFVQVCSADASEVLGQFEAGTIRVLAALAKKRLAPPLDAVPTTVELGLPVDWVIWRGFYAPAGISEEARRRWVELMERVAGSRAWSVLREQMGLVPFFLSGDDFEAFVHDQVRTFRELTRDLGLIE